MAAIETFELAEGPRIALPIWAAAGLGMEFRFLGQSGFRMRHDNVSVS